MEHWDEIKELLNKEVEKRVNLRFNRVKALLGNGRSQKRSTGNVKAKPKHGNGVKQLQGKYMGLTRHLNAAQKVAVKKIREEQGYRKAIAEAKRLQA